MSNINGLYQGVEKVYLAQVFKYGRHLLFDIMLPEPAASLLKAASSRGLVGRNRMPGPWARIRVELTEFASST